MQDFKQLRVWHAAHALWKLVTDSIPERSTRVPGLRARAIRAASSVPNNIAEGCGRSTSADLLSFVDVSLGSLNELEGHMMQARDASVVTGDQYTTIEERITVVRKMLCAFKVRVEHAVALEEEKRRNLRRSRRKGTE